MHSNMNVKHIRMFCNLPSSPWGWRTQVHAFW